jgi:hypothetical protein
MINDYFPELVYVTVDDDNLEFFKSLFAAPSELDVELSEYNKDRGGIEIFNIKEFKNAAKDDQPADKKAEETK